MQIIPIKTRRILETDSLIELMPKLHEGDVVAIVSKVVALTEGKLRRMSKKDSMHEEAEMVLDETMMLTLKDGMLVPSAGVDTSNIAPGFSLGWPENSYRSAAILRRTLCKKFHLKKLGVLIFDSWITPLRNGIVGVSLGYSGFRGVEDYRGTKDLHGNILQITQRNVADGLASAATLVCGEGRESTPFVIIRDAPVHFTSRAVDPSEIRRPPDDCLFRDLYPREVIKKSAHLGA